MFSSTNPHRVRNLVFGLFTLIIFLCLCCIVSAVAANFLVDRQVVVVPAEEQVVVPAEVQVVVVPAEVQVVVPAEEQVVVPAEEQVVVPAEEQVVVVPAGNPAMCGAGQAPQTKVEAAQCFGISADSLTELNGAPGDPFVIGWVIGDPPYVTMLQANIPSGVCLDMARSTSTLTNPVQWQEDYSPVDWVRSLTGGNGMFTGLKATAYWTTCEKRAAQAELPASPTATLAPTALPAPTATPAPTALPAPTATPAPAATPARLCPLPDVPGDWRSIEDGCAFVADNAVFVDYTVPPGVRIDYDGGGKEARANSGEKLTYSGVATFRYLQ